MSNDFLFADSTQKMIPENEFGPNPAASFFLQLERLLERVETSTTHYQILGLGPTATHGQVNRAYLEAIALLYPAYSMGMEMAPGLIARTERAFNKISQSFSVLASFTRRKDYDAALISIAVKSQSPIARSSTPALQPKSPPKPEPSTEDMRFALYEARQESNKSLGGKESNDNRRRCERFKLAAPARITGHDRRTGKWHEMTETVDVSRTGVSVRLRKPVRLGMVLYLTLPLPTKLRTHGYTDPGYGVYALVRRVEPPKKGARVVSFEFLGEHPPAGYLERPWGVFRTKKWVGTERRRASRLERSEIVRLEFLTETMQSLAREETRTENLSRKGFRAAVRAAPVEFDFIRVICPGRSFECLATLRNRYLGKDGRERLCVQFVEKEWPL